MSDDKAREYADKTAAKIVAINSDPWIGPLTFALELAAAYRAGYAEGHAAANRIVVINEGPLNAPRGLS